MNEPSAHDRRDTGDGTVRAAEDSIINRLLSQWEEAFARGEILTAETLCAHLPELVDQVRWKIAALQERDHRKLATYVPGSDASTPAASPGADPHIPAPDKLDAYTRFRQLKFLAKGGLGAVYAAEDGTLNRDVAVKFVHPQLIRDPLCLQRFQVEAEITARLEHPGVVPLHAFGKTDDGRPFYVMRLIRGETLDDAIRRYHENPASRSKTAGQSIEFRDLLGRFVTACQTLAYAHNRGVLHRDIKPQNVMLGRFGETLVVDWGLALPIGRSEHARASGEHTLMPTSGLSSDSSGGGAGTPAFMSPEQAAGHLDLTPASDIFSLGATLYKILTGRAPYEGRTAREVIDRAATASFDTPRSVNRYVPTPIEAVCLKAMARKASDRYETALDLARDVERFLADEPVSIASDSWMQSLGRWSRHHRGAAQSMALIGIVAILGAATAAVAFQRLAGHERGARVAAEAAREQGLRVASRFAARTVAGEVDLRWRILETEANDTELRTALSALNASPVHPEARKTLQAWLDSRYIEHNQTAKASSWFIMGRTGLQQARTPAADTIGENFAFRDYFHGLGHELTPEEAVKAQPIHNVYRSAVYSSRSSGSLKVAFSAPIWSGKVGTPNREVLGVLAMTVDLGEFSVLQFGLGSDQIAVLVDTRADRMEGQTGTNQGLVLHHPAMKDGSEGDRPENYRVHAQYLDRLLKMRATRLEGEAMSETPDNLIRDYRDPLDPPGSGAWLAAFEPVLVRGRPQELRDTGWIVIVQMRDSDLAK
ncbi:MAG TPA: serine/threonine protein kinase [Caulifigura sp.]|nr:serine/threonine protein kinase [Caulifigura sp.]